MIRDILRYPTPLSANYSTDVRRFDDDLFQLIEDLKDTVEANGLEGLAAFQIGNQYNVVVIKQDDGSFLELINPRIIRHSDRTKEEESTAYFPGLSAEVPRYNNISIVYQDRNGENKTLSASGKLARVIQRKIDYTFGSNFLSKLSKEEKKLFEQKLDAKIDMSVIGSACPTTFVRDKFMFVANLIIVAMILNLVASFFVSSPTKEMLWSYQLYASFGVVGFDILYFFYGLYEGKKYKQCTSCQVGNFIGTVAISFVKLTVIMLLSYYFM